MTIQDFVIEVRRDVKEHFSSIGMGDLEVKTTEVVKANDTRVHGLMLIPHGEPAGRSIYIDDLYDRYEDGESMDVILEEIIYRCESGLEAGGPPLGTAMQLDFENVKSRLTVRLLGVRNNISYMADRPYIDVGCGLALIAVVNCEPSAISEWVISVTNELMSEHIGCDTETLMTAALKNTMEIEPPLMVNLEDHMYANMVRPIPVPDYLTQPVPEDKLSGAFMLSNTSMFQGSAALFYPGVMEKIADAFGCGYYVLPSSIHELIILPDTTEPDVEGLKATVLEANATVISREDLLAWDVFHYDPEEGELRIVRERIQERTGCVRESDRTTA